MKSCHLCCILWNIRWFWSQCRGIGLHLELTWGTLNYFPFLHLRQCPSRHVTVFLGSPWSYMKQIKAPYVFYCEEEIAMQECPEIGAHLSVRGNSHSFSRGAGGT